MTERAATLYISYDGVLEPLGESQVVGYLLGLAKTYEITLISFEKPADLADRERVRQMASLLSRHGIHWVRLRYHKSPPVLSTLFDVVVGAAVGVRLAVRGRIRVVHARSYVPSLLGLLLKRLFGARFLFDMRGFWPDEKADAGQWSRQSRIYAIAKYFERRFFEGADAIVSLTHEGVKAFPALGYLIPPEIPIEVIPTCTDMDRFAPGSKDKALLEHLGLMGHLVVGSVGTLSGRYLREPTLACMAVLAARLRPAKVLLISREDHARLQADAARAGIPDNALVLTQLPFTAMPQYLRLIDLGVFFIDPGFSKKGMMATKLGEFLATGIPVVINDGMGDSGWIVRDNRAGVVLDRPSVQAAQDALPEIVRLLHDPRAASRCRATAQRCFELGAGVEKYTALYERLASQSAR